LGIEVRRWVGHTLRGLRAQASLEYLAAFSAALSVISAAGYVLLGAGSSIGNLAPASCSFDLGINCHYLSIVSNSSSTYFVLVGSNDQEYPITNVRMSILAGGKPTTAQCATGEIKPGEAFVCLAKLGSFQQPGAQVSGNIIASVGYCGFGGGDCSSAVQQSYVGTYVASTGRYTKPQIGLVLFSPSMRSNGPYAINASFDVFGYSLYLGTITLTPQPGSQPHVSYSGPGISSLNISVSTLSNGCAAVLNVTYLNQTAVDVYALNASNYTSTRYTLSGNTNGACFALSNSTKTVSVSGKNNTAGLFTLSDVFINVSSTGSYNNLAIFNSTATLKIAGNNNNVTMFDSNVVLDITGTYNRVKFINSRISALTKSGNNNLVVLDNTTVARQSVTGTNDIIQGS